jgi:hypothetical protein
VLGKASEIKTYLVVEMYGTAIDDEISKVLENNPSWEVLDIKFSIMADQVNGSFNSVYHEALIIYKEAV